MQRGEEKCFLAAHAASDRVDPLVVDAEPGERRFEDARHPGEIVDLAAPAPRVRDEPPSLPARVDDRERAECGEASPQSRVRLRRTTAAVRRDDERNGRVRSGPVPLREHEHRCASGSVPGGVTDPHLPDQRDASLQQVPVTHPEADQLPQRRVRLGKLRRGLSDWRSRTSRLQANHADRDRQRQHHCENG